MVSPELRTPNSVWCPRNSGVPGTPELPVPGTPDRTDPALLPFFLRIASEATDQHYHERPEPDGAIFAFVQDTDPEVLLILENRAHGDGTRWEFAIAPMNGWPLIAWHKARKFWSVERRHPAHDPTQT
jgi:hypothetical protein